MKRKIIKIDEELCNGCGVCANACHEGAIGMINGKAKLLRDDYCDGLGDCLPVCEAGAITFEEREAAPYDKVAVEALQAAKKSQNLPCGYSKGDVKTIKQESELRQWPVQLKLVPENASYLDGEHLLIAADCAAYAYADFHRDFMHNKISLIGCPKLDGFDYSEKLTVIFRMNRIKSVTVARMEVPCCGGIEYAVKTALQNCEKMIPWQVVTITTDGKILEQS